MFFTLAGEKVLGRAGSVPGCFITVSTARLGTILARFGHVFMFTLPMLIMPSRAGTVLAWFKWQCKCSIRVFICGRSGEYSVTYPARFLYFNQCYDPSTGYGTMFCHNLFVILVAKQHHLAYSNKTGSRFA